MDKEEKTVSQAEEQSVAQTEENQPSSQDDNENKSVPQKKKEKEKTSVSHKVFTGIGIALCVILIPMLIINITLIIKSYTNKNGVPSIGGNVPLIVLTDSMYPEIKSGDLIICHTIDADDVKESDVISFFDPSGSGSSVVTHRVVEVVNEDGKLYFRTKGDNNNIEDKVLVPAENLVGIYKVRLAGLGNVAMFMQTTPGLIVCVIVPIILLVGYDVIRRIVYDKKNKEDTDALIAELNRLKAEKARKEKEEAEAAAAAAAEEIQGGLKIKDIEVTQTVAKPQEVKEEPKTVAKPEVAKEEPKTVAKPQEAKEEPKTVAKPEEAKEAPKTVDKESDK